jgi:hypothetical protein
VHGALRVEVMLNFRRPLKAMLNPLKGILTGEFRDRFLSYRAFNHLHTFVQRHVQNWGYD